MTFTVECIVAFEQTHDLGPAINICVGDWLDFSGRFSREIRSPRVSIRKYLRGERIEFPTLATRNAFLQHHPGKFRSI